MGYKKLNDYIDNLSDIKDLTIIQNELLYSLETCEQRIKVIKKMNKDNNINTDIPYEGTTICYLAIKINKEKI